jgi:hypothetical protein
MEVKADAQLGEHQRGVAKPAKGESEVAIRSGDNHLAKLMTLIIKPPSSNKIIMKFCLHFQSNNFSSN